MKTFTILFSTLLCLEAAAASAIPASYIEVLRRDGGISDPQPAASSSDSNTLEQNSSSSSSFTQLSERDVAEIEYINALMAADHNCMGGALHCGCTRWALCLGSAGGALATCGFAAAAVGKDFKEDVKCAAAITSFSTNLPRNCRLCLGM